jgi:glycosyltransferase involved in cell wall biosynthesis
VLVLDGLYIAGAQRHCLELLKVFGRSGLSRVVVALEGGGRWAERFLADCEHLIVSDGTPVYWSDLRHLVGGVATGLFSAHLMRAAEWTATTAPEGATCFAHLHCEPSEHEPVTADWMHSHLHRFDRVFVPARSTHDALLSLLVASDPLRDKFLVLPNAIPPESTEAPLGPRKPDAELRVATVSRIDADKFSTSMFIGTCDSLTARGIRFQIEVAGDGELLPTLKEAVALRSWARSVRFRGFVNDVKSIYNWADLVFLPSKRESVPYVLLEALGYRRPIVGPATGVLSELAESGLVFLYRPGDAVGAADAIVRASALAGSDAAPPLLRVPAASIPDFSEWERMVSEAYSL